MKQDSELLREYADNRSEAAFSEFVRRNIDFVYSNALRQVGGDAHHAADVAQQVFISIAQQPTRLLGVRVLCAWLYTATRNVAANLVRTDRRRQAREIEAHTMNDQSSLQKQVAEPERLRPLIDAALASLGERDREAVLLRYFAGNGYPEIGEKLSLSADAARLRAERALDKMGRFLKRRGILSTSSALAAICTSEAAVVAPAMLVNSVVTASLASASCATELSYFGLSGMGSGKAGLCAVVLLVSALGLGWQYQLREKLTKEVAATKREKNELTRLEEQLASLRARGVPEGSSEENSNKAALRTEVLLWQKRVEEAKAEVALSPGLVPSAMWKKAGQETPGEAFETLQCAMDTVDTPTLGKLIYLSPENRTTAAKILNGLPADFRQRLEINTPEELIGFASAMREPLAGAEVTGTTLQKDDEVTVNSMVQRISNTEIGPGVGSARYCFRHIGLEWRWVVSEWQFEAALREITREVAPR